MSQQHGWDLCRCLLLLVKAGSFQPIEVGTNSRKGSSMKGRILMIASLVAICVIVLCVSPNQQKVSAQTSEETSKQTLKPVYNPYPPGILPSDLNSELARVAAEVDFVEARALARWKALTPPTLTNQPPVLANTGTEAVETLGEVMNYDRNISPKRNTACSSCHMPYAAFSGPIPSVNLTMIAYPGTLRHRAGKRTAQRYTYSPDFPVLEYQTTQGAFFGGNFWDARSTGYKLQSSDAERAHHPPVDTQEMGFPDTACIAFRLSSAVY